MRLRRRHRDGWSLPSGLAEVELFRFWEADLAGTRPPEVAADSPADAAAPEGSADPLWWAAGLVFVAVLLVVLV